MLQLLVLPGPVPCSCFFFRFGTGNERRAAISTITRCTGIGLKCTAAGAPINGRVAVGLLLLNLVVGFDTGEAEIACFKARTTCLDVKLNMFGLLCSDRWQPVPQNVLVSCLGIGLLVHLHAVDLFRNLNAVFLFLFQTCICHIEVCV